MVLVVELINSATREWRSEVITGTFRADVAARILRISLAKIPHDDELVWRGEPSGELIVRSAYKLLQAKTYTRMFYGKLWSLNLPSKLKITVWHISNKFIPSMSNLYFKRLSGTGICPRFRDGVESLAHVFWGCPVIDRIEENVHTRVVDIARWEPSSGDWVKINFDATFDKNLFRLGSRFVAKNARRRVVASGSTIHEMLVRLLQQRPLPASRQLKWGSIWA
ncbi:hypothetical protein Goarm_023027 [Gossypium armourianum]|uniref:Reverse transcriptase zinc-binding domain-containing protein n=1 Tax=Gossypium armourianum TaxID=34283 RepID=A0A7J9KH54_9ROSI|nr:hypothetical protein [Gossypium armourianum]